MRKGLLIVVFLAMVGAWLFAETRLGDVVMKDVVVLEPVDKTNLVNMIVAATNNITVTESDPVAMPRITAVEGRTNAWNTAYTHSQTDHGVSEYLGFWGGEGASAVTGGAVGKGAYTDIGGAVGQYATADTGGAVGFNAETGDGFAGGKNATANAGGAVGEGAYVYYGGAVGYSAKTGDGFAGGKEAITLSGPTLIDAIQLGTGNNPNARTLQIYTNQLLDAQGNIPLARMSANLPSETDPVATPLINAHTGRTDNPHGVTAEGIGALTAEADTLATVTARGATTTEAVTIGIRGTGDIGGTSLAQGYGVIASGHYSHAEGGSTTASGFASHAEGYGTRASGLASHAEGNSTTASGDYSHAEGGSTTASGFASHAEGYGTEATGYASHAEGYGTEATGYASHAEGYFTTASGDYSHAEGYFTTASGDYSHASGFKAYIPDSDDCAFAWQGTEGSFSEPQYNSHGPGTFNINPVDGLAGFYVGETNLATTLGGYATTGAVAAVRAEVEAAASPKLTMVPAGTTVISTDTTVQVVPTRGIYNLYMMGDSDIAFDLSAIDITNNVARWETWIKVFAPGVTVGLPSTNAVQYLETPDLTTTTANELLQVSWQAWMDGTNLMMQGHLYNRRTDMPAPTLAEMRAYHYDDSNIVESPASWFIFDPVAKTITGYNYVEGRENVVIPWEIGGVAVEVLGDSAFSPNWTGWPITNVVAGRSVLSIEAGAFVGCTSLTSATLPVATSIGDSAFNNCTLLTSATLPVATSIGDYAFYSCTSLTSATLPAATSIGNYVFYNCTLLSRVYFGNAKPTEGEEMFTDVPGPVTIYYPDGAPAWIGVMTWGGMPTAPYTP